MVIYELMCRREMLNYISIYTIYIYMYKKIRIYVLTFKKFTENSSLVHYLLCLVEWMHSPRILIFHGNLTLQLNTLNLIMY